MVRIGFNNIKSCVNIVFILKGYINECGVLNLKRLEIFMERLSALDRLQFSDANADLQYFSSKLTDDTVSILSLF